MAIIPEIKNTKQLSLDFIAGLIAGEGCFTWSYDKNEQKITIFQLKMRSNDKNLVFAVRNSLGLKAPIYEYNYQDKKKVSLIRHYVVLKVGNRKDIKEKIIPAFEGRLYGLKKTAIQYMKSNIF